MHNNLNKKRKSFSTTLFLLLTLFSLSKSQKTTPINLDQKITGKLNKDDSREYYTLSIPKNKDIEEGSLLVFTVKESRKGIKEGDEIFSDPDIYISKTKKYPSKMEEAEWYSQRYGNDILTIPPNDLKKGDIFYICMYCQYKCRYELKAYLTKEIPLKLGKFYNFQMLKGESYSYSLYIPKNEKKEDLNIVANNPNLQNFKIFMSQNSPSSQNTLQVIPSWAGCFLIPVTKNMKEYCNDCTFHILIQAQDNIEISFNSYFQNTITEIFQGDPINDAIKKGYKRCYEFDLKNREKLKNNKLLIQTYLFSGSVLLKLYGWNKKNIEEKLNITNLNEDKYLYTVDSDKIILLNKDDFSYFDNNFISSSEESKKLYLCIESQQITSYLLNVYFLSEAENLQRYNYISPGSELTGYLQGGQVTRYQLLDFNLNKNSDITFLFTTLNGNIEYYSSFCSESCRFSNYFLKEKLKIGEVKISEKIPINSARIILKKEENKCYLENKDKKINAKCKTLAIIKCDGSPEDICIFKILPTIQEQPTFLFPKKTYYNVITKGKIDNYIFNIGDPEYNSAVVVLTTLTGDAELSVYKKTKKSDGIDDEALIGVSRNKDYIPDVVRITPQILNSKNVTGQYIVKITSDYFSSYNLYYYTTRIKKRDEQPNIKDITASLIEGKIISDYFPNDLPFKIYSYTPIDKSKYTKDIKIVLTRLNVNFSFKVYLDFNKIKYNYNAENKYEEKLQNYLWSSDLNNELTISKDDKNYSKKGPYYIVVTKDEDDENNELDTNALTLYYLGVTKKGIPFSLTEGVEHSETLSDNYNFQNYWYIHQNIYEPFQMEINVLNGQVDVFVNVNELSEENITNLYKNYTEKDEEKFTVGNTVGYFNIRDYTSIELDYSYFEKIGNNLLNKSSLIFIYINQSKYSLKFHEESQYIISAKSSLNKGMILLSGETIYSQFNSQRTDHYIIQEVKHRKGTAINLRFKKGDGEIYVNIADSKSTELEYPDEKKYDYKGTYAYKGKIVKIPAKVFDRINKKSLKLKILISIIPKFNTNTNEVIEYYINYSSETKKINQNFPYQSYITAGEYQYFNFYFGKNTQNIYISLSNMNGDADMYLNYGVDNLPSPSNNDFSSTNIGHEYIDINKNNQFFKDRNKNDVSGYYTLLILGYTETMYTLYISSHEDNILTLTNNSPVSCRCHIKNDKCYFRFNDVFINNKSPKKNNINNNLNQNEVFFTTQYVYGNGKMYAKILKDQEITEDTKKKYQEFFPTEKSYDFSNSIIGKRNYLKVIAEGNNYSKDSLILLTFICEERTDVSITAAAANIKPLYAYLDRDRENIFFLKTNNTLKFKDQYESIFNFFSHKEEDLIYEIHAYTGKAKIRIYTNESKWDDNTKKFVYDYNHISEFNIKADNINDEYSYIKTYKESYFNSISKSLIINKNVYFSVKPYEDFGFYIQVLYDRSWINIPIGTTKSYLINKNLMYGYFDIARDFSNVEISLSLEESNKKYASVYAKILIITKDPKNFISDNPDEKSKHQEIPSYKNYDYKGETDEILGTLNLNLENLPIIKDEERGIKFVRVLFTIKINKIYNKNKYYSEKDNSNSETNIKITITPGVNNFKRVDLPQHTYYLSNTTLIPNREKNVGIAYDGSKEVKIYSLDKKSSEDKKMFIDISICNGDFEFKISNKITNYDENNDNIFASLRNTRFGSYRYLIDNLSTDKNKHLYFSIKPKQNNLECLTGQKKDSKGVECSKELSYLIYYYSMTNKEYESKKPDNKLQYEYGKNKQILLVIKPIRGSDFKNNFREQNDIEYNLFYTKKREYCHYMESICHLSQVLNDMPSYNETLWHDGDIVVNRNIKVDENYEYPINDIEADDIICVNVLARNLKTNELIAYFPFMGSRAKTGFFYKFILWLVIGLVVTGLYFLYNRYKNNKNIENYQHPGIQTEMKNMGKVGYTSISLGNY